MGEPGDYPTPWVGIAVVVGGFAAMLGTAGYFSYRLWLMFCGT